MLGIYYWIAICFPKEIDAFLFSGPEQFFNGAPMFSPLPFTMIFRREFDRFHRVDRSRCSKMLGIYYWTLVHTDSIYHPATTAAPLSILFGTHPPSRYILHLFFFPAILLLFLLVFFLSFFLFLELYLFNHVFPPGAVKSPSTHGNPSKTALKPCPKSSENHVWQGTTKY